MGFFGAPFKSKGAETAAGTGTRRAFRRSIFLRSRGGERRLRALENGGVLFLNETGRQLELAANAAEHRQIRDDEHFFLLRPLWPCCWDSAGYSVSAETLPWPSAPED